MEFIAINSAEFIVYRDESKTREISLSSVNSEMPKLHVYQHALKVDPELISFVGYY